MEKSLRLSAEDGPHRPGNVPAWKPWDRGSTLDPRERPTAWERRSFRREWQSHSTSHLPWRAVRRRERGFPVAALQRSWLVRSEDFLREEKIENESFPIKGSYLCGERRLPVWKTSWSKPVDLLRPVETGWSKLPEWRQSVFIPLSSSVG